jgi:dipeptidyl aminopeptidase/acylaminoacyl peptidase
MQKVAATDIYKIKTLSRPVAAGAQVFFNENWIDEASGEYRSRILLFNRDTRQRTLFGTGGGHDQQLALAPDQQTLAFVAPDAAGVKQVYMQPLTGGAATVASKSKAGVQRFFWAGDGQSFFYQEARVPAKPQRPQPQRYTRVDYRSNEEGAFPLGEETVLLRQRLAGGKPEVLLKQAERFTLDAVAPHAAILALHTLAHPEDPSNDAQRNWLLDADSGVQTELQTGLERGSLHAISFSPDGQHLLLGGQPTTAPDDMRVNLFSYDLATGHCQLAQDNADIAIGESLSSDVQQNLSGRAAAFLPDGNYVVSALIAGTVGLYQGAELRPIFSGKYHVTDFALSADGRGAYITLSTTTQASRLFYLDLATGQQNELYNPNAEYEATHLISQPEAFSFERAGFTIHGWYYAPTETATAQKHPALLNIHGGPYAAYGETFHHELQYQTAQGYGVIVVNPRGSTSYGNAFETAVIGDYGQGDYADLLGAVDDVLARKPQIDRQRLYCTGGSYGGFMSNWIAGHTQRFTAIATCRSICNWTSIFGASDIGFTFVPLQLQRRFSGDVADQETLWRFSPLAYVDRVQTPILILHSENDYRTPIDQAEQWFTSLKLHGVETEFLRFPLSNHGLSRSGLPYLRIARLQAVMDWFDQHQ